MAPSIMAGIPALKELNGDLRRRMDQAVATFQATLASTRTGRASVHMLDAVKVDYYGTHTPITQLAQVSTPEAQLIVISPWDPAIVKEIEKALLVADLGLNPQSDGKVIRVPIPPMTEERRRDVVKHLNRVLEEHRTAIRNVRVIDQRGDAGRAEAVVNVDYRRRLGEQVFNMPRRAATPPKEAP
jgi:ribosome recycling factor